MSTFEGPKTDPDAHPLDLTEHAEAERPALEELGKTPKVNPICQECAGDVEIIGWGAPADASAAWSEYRVCVRSVLRSWAFCVRTGGCHIAGVRYDFERRKKPRESSEPCEWSGPDRRRTGG